MNKFSISYDNQSFSTTLKQEMSISPHPQADESCPYPHMRLI